MGMHTIVLKTLFPVYLFEYDKTKFYCIIPQNKCFLGNMYILNKYIHSYIFSLLCTGSTLSDFILVFI